MDGIHVQLLVSRTRQSSFHFKLQGAGYLFVRELAVHHVLLRTHRANARVCVVPSVLTNTVGPTVLQRKANKGSNSTGLSDSSPKGSRQQENCNYYSLKIFRRFSLAPRLTLHNQPALTTFG